MTKIVIPIKEDLGENSFPSQHFGRFRWFYLVDGKTVHVIENNSDHFGGSGKPPDTILKLGVDVLITTNMGRKAIEIFQNSDVAVFLTQEQPIRNILEDFKQGRLDELTEGCTHSKH